MARYEVDGKVYDTKIAAAEWPNARRFDGSNMVSCATGSQWIHETLFLSRKGQFFVETISQWQGSFPSARLLTDPEAVLWLDCNDWEVPERLSELTASLEG